MRLLALYAKPYSDCIEKNKGKEQQKLGNIKDTYETNENQNRRVTAGFSDIKQKALLVKAHRHR